MRRRKLCKCFSREQKPVWRWLISLCKHFTQPCELSAVQKGCHNVMNEAYIFWPSSKEGIRVQVGQPRPHL